MVDALKLVPARPVNCTVVVTGGPKACADMFTGLGAAAKPGVEPGASTVMGMIRVWLAALLEVSTRLPVLNPGPSAPPLIEMPMAVGVVVALALYVTNFGTDDTVNVKLLPML